MEFFKTITQEHLDTPDEYNTRELLHLYDFQKFYLYMSIERLFEFVEVKIEHDWHCEEHKTKNKLSEEIIWKCLKAFD